jgi:hypothetical protein
LNIKKADALYTLACASLVKEGFLAPLIGGYQGYHNAPEGRETEGMLRGGLGAELGSALGMVPGMLTQNPLLALAGAGLGGYGGYQALKIRPDAQQMPQQAPAPQAAPQQAAPAPQQHRPAPKKPASNVPPRGEAQAEE